MKKDERIRVVVKCKKQFKSIIENYCIDNYITLQYLVNESIFNLLHKDITFEIEQRFPINDASIICRIMPEEKKQLLKLSKIKRITMSELIIQELQRMVYKGRY